MWDSFFHFREVIAGSWKSVQLCPFRLLFAWCEQGWEGSWRGMSWSSSLPKGTWESKCWIYSFNHEGLSTTNWKVFDQDVYTFNLSPGIERPNGKTHAEATIFILPHGLWIFTQCLRIFTYLLPAAKMKSGEEKHPNNEKIRKVKTMREKNCLGKGRLVVVVCSEIKKKKLN